MSLEEPGEKKNVWLGHSIFGHVRRDSFWNKEQQKTTFCFDLTAIPIAVLPILVWVSLLQAHVLTHKLNCSPTARLETPINNALCALHLAICFFFVCFYPANELDPTLVFTEIMPPLCRLSQPRSRCGQKSYMKMMSSYMQSWFMQSRSYASV